MGRLFTVILLLLLNSVVVGQAGPGNAPVITSWYQDMPGAISVTFDDAGYSQYESAYPILEKLSIKATFGVVGEWVKEEPVFTSESGAFDIRRMGWKQIREIAAKGHEIAAHGYTHESYDDSSPVDELTAGMKAIRDTILVKAGVEANTLIYPYSYATGNIPVAAGQAGFLFGRTGLDSHNPADPGNMYLLASRAILNESMPDSAAFRRWIAQSEGQWLILMYHHLFAEDSREMQLLGGHGVRNTYAISPGLFAWQMQQAKNSGYWVATLASIGKYIVARENTTLRSRLTKKKIVIRTSTTMDTSLYDQPLSLLVELPWETICVEGSLHDGNHMLKEKRFIIDFKPGAKIVIKRKQQKL